MELRVVSDLNSQARTDPVAISGMGSVKGTGKFRKLNVTLGNLTIHLTPLSGKEEPLDPPVLSEKTGAEPPFFPHPSSFMLWAVAEVTSQSFWIQ